MEVHMTMKRIIQHLDENDSFNKKDIYGKYWIQNIQFGMPDDIDFLGLQDDIWPQT